uniref:ARAD1A09790p n=1 Tax=Blastobotrys adeninivorans TaxID=409370 RepID=A0A060T2M9_BLAAD
MSELKLYGHEEYEDVTEVFFNEAKKLSIGELVHTPSFTLFSGVHALEIGSDKMDTGLQYRPLEEEIQSLPAVQSAKDFILLADALMAREISWHQGSMLLQNVFSCLQVEQVLQDLKSHQQSRSVQVYLDSLISGEMSWQAATTILIVSILKSIDLAMGPLGDMSAVFPEEDVILHTSDYYILEDVDRKAIVRLLEAVLVWTKGQLQGEGKDTVKRARDRVRLRIQFLQVLERKLPVHPQLQEAIVTAKSIADEPKPTEAEETKFEVCFSDRIQARVTNTSPLRPVAKADDPYPELVRILQGFETVSDVFGMSRSTDLLSFFLTFSATRPRPLPIVRGMLKTVVDNQTICSKPLSDWVIQDITELVCPFSDSVFNDPRPEIQQLLSMFMDVAVLCYLDLVTTMCQNRSRQRQNLAHCIVSFDSLQVSAEQLETELARAIPTETILFNGQRVPAVPISSWVYLRKLQIMIWVALLGFELDVYKPWEYSQMYSYTNFLFTSLTDHLARIKAYVEQKSRRTGTTRSHPVQGAIGYLGALELESNALNQLCIASMCLARRHEIEGLVGLNPERLTTSHELLYGLRMKPFSSVGVPETPSYQDYVKVRSGISKSHQALAQTKDAANLCRRIVDSLAKVSAENEELGLLKRSAVSMGVIASQLEKPNPPNTRVEVKRDGNHWFFPVMQAV